MIELAASPHLTQAQKKTFRNIAAERDAYLEKRRQQERTLSQDIGM